MKEKFVILANPRTGSEYLAKLLDRHSSVQCFGEIFSEGPDGLEWNNSEFKSNKDTFGYLDYEFSKTDKNICGYKQISYWIRNSGFKDVRDFIYNNYREGYKFIFISRKNLLKEYVSFMIMMEKGYGHISEDKKKKMQLRIDPSITYITMRKWKGFNNTCKKVFQDLGIDYLDLVYEEDFFEEKKVKERVFKFLSVEDENIEDPLKPTNPYPIEELIENYDEVYKYLKSKGWYKN